MLEEIDFIDRRRKQKAVVVVGATDRKDPILTRDRTFAAVPPAGPYKRGTCSGFNLARPPLDSNTGRLFVKNAW